MRGNGKIRWFVIGALVLVSAEMVLRYFDLHHPLLYEATEYGYRAVPLQDLRRFGNRIYYNAQGLRSESMAAVPEPGVLRVLCVGDSITNGGTQTDQGLTYPYLLQAALYEQHIRAEVLNASAGGWALENEAGWLDRFGIFNSAVVIFEVGTNDLFQAKTDGNIVGKHPSFPDHAPLLATQEVIFRYLLPALGMGRTEDPGVILGGGTEVDVARSMVTLGRMISLVRDQGVRPYVLFVEQPALLEPRDELTLFAKQRLIDTLKQYDVPLIRPAAAMESRGGARLFRDGLHPNADGNQVIARQMTEAMQVAYSELSSRR